MSEENMNNSSNDETAALFVSNQKKKAAEEAARKKAEEEKARLEAAEAEARRMEQEVEERKRRAEEEKRALEEEERALAEGRINFEAKSQAEPVKPKKVKEPKEPSAGGKSKLPIYIGIGAAVVVVIIIAVVALSGKGGAGSSDSVAQMETTQLNDEFNTEYVSKEEGFDLKFMYPAGMYTEVNEEKGDGEVTIHFGPQGVGNIDTDIVITDYKWDNNDAFIMDYNACMCPSNDFQTAFRDKITNKAKELIPDISVTEEKSADVAAEDTDRYYYKCSFTSAEKGNGAISAWVGVNGKGECKRIVVCCRDTAENSEGCKKLCDTFTDKYAGEVLKLPGNNPPKSTEADAVLDVDDIHMGIIAPANQFVKNDVVQTAYTRFTDRNGAQIIVHAAETEVDLTTGEANITREEIHENYKAVAEVGINDYYTTDSRMFLDEQYDSRETTIDYTGNYRVLIGGTKFWERDRIGYWTDSRTQKHYTYLIITLVPEKDQDIYKQIFDRSLDMLKDI